MKRMQAAELQSASAKVAQWLLHGPAQLSSGPHAGAVVGVLDRSGHGAYAYCEIVGYYLQWLAWYAGDAAPDVELAPRAAAAQRWLRAWVDLPQPLTRIYLREPVEDWRNRTRFTFDCAMAIRGVASAAAMGLVQPDANVVAGLGRELRGLIGADGRFDACLRPREVELPQRWSTQRGGFLAKAAAGVIHASSILPDLDGDVVAAAHSTFEAALDWALESPHDDVHALLYTFEGLLALRDDARPAQGAGAVAAQYAALLQHIETRSRIPERLSDASGPQRADVLAQTVRIGDLLADTMPDVVRRRLAPLRHRLAESIRVDGSVPFALDDPHSVANVWAAMFASQALAGMPPAAAPLIV